MRPALGLFLAFSLGLQGQKFNNLKEALKNPLKVIELDLSKQNLSTFPLEVLQCPNLKVLDLSHNAIRVLPNNLSTLSQLEELDLAKNELTQISSALSQLPKLRVLKVSRNPISRLEANLNLYPALEILDLWNCEVDFVSPDLTQNNTLKEIDLRQNYLGTRELVWLLKAMPKVEIKTTYGCNCN